MHKLGVILVVIFAIFVGCGADTITDAQTYRIEVVETVPIRLVYHRGEHGMYAPMYSVYYDDSDDEVDFLVWRSNLDTLEVIDTVLNVLPYDLYLTYWYVTDSSSVIDTVQIYPVADSVYHFGYRRD